MPVWKHEVLCNKMDGVVPELMSVRERNLLNDYHAQVYEKISPYLDEEEREWLKDATRAI